MLFKRKESPLPDALTKRLFLKAGLSGCTALALVLTTGCVTAPPAQEMSDARQSLEAAHTVGAHEHAPEVFGNAQHLLSRAESDMNSGNYEKAQRDAVAALEAARQAAAIAQAKQETVASVNMAAAETEVVVELTPEPIAPQIIPEPAMPSHYVVETKDSLWGIAAKPSVYGDARLWPLLLKANADVIKSPDVIKPGITLQIERAPSAAEIETALEYSRRRGTSPLRSSDSGYLRQYGLR